MVETTVDATKSTTLMGVGIGAVSMGIALIAAGKLQEGAAIAAIGFIALFVKYKFGY